MPPPAYYTPLQFKYPQVRALPRSAGAPQAVPSGALGCVSWDNDALFCLLVTTSRSLGTAVASKAGWMMTSSSVAERSSTKLGKSCFTLSLPSQELPESQPRTKGKHQLTWGTSKVRLARCHSRSVQKGSHWSYEGENPTVTASSVPSWHVACSAGGGAVLLVWSSARLRVSLALAPLS